MVKTKVIQEMEDIVTAYKSFFIDLPFASTRWSFGLGGEKEVAEAAWSGYDAVVRLSSAAVDTVYRAPVFSEFTSRSLYGLLRAQRVGNAFAGAMFTGLWHTIGLPTATETQALRAEMQALRKEVRALTTSVTMNGKESRTAQRDEQRETPQVKLRANGVAKSMRSAA
jgi:hypothetical protein